MIEPVYHSFSTEDLNVWLTSHSNPKSVSLVTTMDRAWWWISDESISTYSENILSYKRLIVSNKLINNTSEIVPAILHTTESIEMTIHDTDEFRHYLESIYVDFSNNVNVVNRILDLNDIRSLDVVNNYTVYQLGYDSCTYLLNIVNLLSEYVSNLKHIRDIGRNIVIMSLSKYGEETASIIFKVLNDRLNESAYIAASVISLDQTNSQIRNIIDVMGE